MNDFLFKYCFYLFEFLRWIVDFTTLNGLKSVKLVQVVNIENDLKCNSALVMNLIPSNSEAILLGGTLVRDYCEVSSTNNLIQIEAGLYLFSIIINSLSVDVSSSVHASDLDLSQNCVIETRTPNSLYR